MKIIFENKIIKNLDLMKNLYVRYGLCCIKYWIFLLILIKIV